MLDSNSIKFNINHVFFYRIQTSKQSTAQVHSTATSLQAQIDDYLDKHRDLIKYAKKGYIKTVAEGLKNDSGLMITESKLRRAIATYRTTHNCPIEYVPNKYYKPSASNGKRAYLKPTEQEEEELTEEEETVEATHDSTPEPVSAPAPEPVPVPEPAPEPVPEPAPEPAPVPVPVAEEEAAPTDVLSALILLIKKIDDLVDAVECADLMRHSDTEHLELSIDEIGNILNFRL